MDQKEEGRLDVKWDDYWNGFMSNPLLEKLRFSLVSGAYNRLMKSFDNKNSPLHFCELGAGTGAMSKYLGRRYQADISVVDSNAMALDLCKKNFEDFKGEFSVIVRDVFDVKDHNGQFDLVHSGGLIEHFVGDMRQEIIQAHCDLVKEGGYILILVPTHNAWYKVLNEGIFKFLHLLDTIPEVPWSFDELLEALRKRGFEVVAKTSVISEIGVLARRV